MRFQFDGNQAYQLRAIEAVADLFRGQSHVSPDFSTFEFGEIFSPVSNRLDLAEDQILANRQAVQKRHGIPEDERLQCIEAEITCSRGVLGVRFPNFSVEMETGTGKTYVYLRTALELHRRYGMRKFIVVVPSVAVREGVLKSLKITQHHLRALYDNVPSASPPTTPKASARCYLVRETKSTTVADELRGTENQKIHCGERHFTGALKVDF